MDIVVIHCCYAGFQNYFSAEPQKEATTTIKEIPGMSPRSEKYVQAAHLFYLQSTGHVEVHIALIIY